MTPTEQRARDSVLALGDVHLQLAALVEMTVAQLSRRYLELYGEPSRSHNKAYLRKRLAWRIQELAEGGLSAGALDRIAALRDRMPERWRRRLQPVAATPAQPTEAPPAPPEPVVSEPRDPRLPAPGTIVRRTYEGTTHEVTVRADDFEYAGQPFRTLSAVARHITGTAWNGFTFFNLGKRASA